MKNFWAMLVSYAPEIRNVMSALAGVGVALGLFTQVDATTMLNAVNTIGDGLGKILGALSILVPAVMAILAKRAALKNQTQTAAAVASFPGVKAVVMKTQAAADAVPSSKVIGPS